MEKAANVAIRVKKVFPKGFPKPCEKSTVSTVYLCSSSQAREDKEDPLLLTDAFHIGLALRIKRTIVIRLFALT